MRAGTKKGASAYVGAQGYRPKRGPRVNPRSVVCPDCGAEVDAPCVSLGESRAPGSAPKGEPVAIAHRSRKRIATRRFNEAREAEKNSAELPSESP